MATREQNEDELSWHWTSSKASPDDVLRDIREVTGKTVPEEQEDATKNLSDEEVQTLRDKLSP